MRCAFVRSNSFFFFIIQSPLVDSCGYGTVVHFLRFKLLNQWIETESILVCVCVCVFLFINLSTFAYPFQWEQFVN